MDNQHLLLNDVARVLGLKAHQIAYALATGQVAEPALRVANKRIFGEEDVQRLAAHFRVSPRWSSINPAADDNDQDDRHESLTLKPPFEVLQVGETGHEVRDGEGAVYCWASDRARAMVIAGLLDSAVRV